ncbi:MAG: TetR/AcrR family transcriptional regulator [Burkholderiales bacterium]
MCPLAKLIEPRWERRKDARPGELAAAALDLFIEKGFSATRLDDVAKRAGVSKGTLYLYFDSKEALFKSVIQEGIVSRIAEGEAYMRAYDGTSADLMRHLINTWWDQIGGTKLGGITKLMMSESGNFPELAAFYHDEVITRAMGLFVYVIERGIKAGEFRAMPMDYVPRICAAPVVMLMLWRHSFDVCGAKDIDPKAYLQTHTDMLIHSLRATVPEPTSGSHAAK